MESVTLFFQFLKRISKLQDLSFVEVNTVQSINSNSNNSIFPVKTFIYFSDPRLFIYCCDFSSVAIDLVKVQHMFLSF